VIEGVKHVRVNSLDGVGDYVHSEDVAHALIALLEARTLAYSVYNIAAGVTATLADLVRWRRKSRPDSMRRSFLPTRPTSCRTTPHGKVRGAPTTWRVSNEIPVGSPGPCARPSMLTSTGSPPAQDPEDVDSCRDCWTERWP